MDKVNELEEFIGKLMDYETRTKIEELLMEAIPEDVIIYTKDPDFDPDEGEALIPPIEFSFNDWDANNRWAMGTQFRRVGSSLECIQQFDDEEEFLPFDCNVRVDISPENYRAILSIIESYKDGNFGTEDEVNSITFY